MFHLFYESSCTSFLLIVCVAIVTLRSYGINALPGPLYVITANTEIIFTTMLNRLWLKKELTWHQYVAVNLVMIGVCMGLYDPSCHCFGSDPYISNKELWIGLSCSILSRFVSALNSNLAEKILGNSRKSIIGVNKVSFINSFVPFILVPLLGVLVGETKEWKPQIQAAVALQSAAGLTAIFLGLVFSKMFDRLAKFTIVMIQNSVFFGLVDVLMKCTAGFGSVLLFKEEANWPDYLGLCIVVSSFFPYTYGSHIMQERLKGRKALVFKDGLASDKGSLNGDVEEYSHSADITDFALEQPLLLNSSSLSPPLAEVSSYGLIN